MAHVPHQVERARLEHRARSLEAALAELKRTRRADRAPKGLGSAIAGFHAELRAVRERLGRTA